MRETNRQSFYKMKEVCVKLGIEAHVIRFWEKEFPQLHFRKNSSGHRIFTDRDLDLLGKIQDLLHNRGMTIEGARSMLKKGKDPSRQQANLNMKLLKVKSLAREAREYTEELIKSLDSE
ncbi:MAG: MerR family transcriptional regulator [Acidobacteria bacterium]|nr:MAG: MerR family transcriptional regulator [Acidobacteriota bacterium]